MVASTEGQEDRLLALVGESMKRLVSVDDWLSDAHAKPHPTYYQQYLLYADPHDRFSVVSFVWGPGQSTPVHDHLVWGVIGMLRGAEVVEHFDADARFQLNPRGEASVLTPGKVGFVSPTIGDIHRVRNAYDDRASISIHAYGGNIGKIDRHVYSPEVGTRKSFVSGYANA
nr:cysteine dioxygenase [Pseudorhodoferax soli]